MVYIFQKTPMKCVYRIIKIQQVLQKDVINVFEDHMGRTKSKNLKIAILRKFDTFLFFYIDRNTILSPLKLAIKNGIL